MCFVESAVTGLGFRASVRELDRNGGQHMSRCHSTCRDPMMQGLTF